METKEKITQAIEKWIKQKSINENFEYYVNDEWFIITFPAEIEEKLIEKIYIDYQKVPCMRSYGSYGLWEYARIIINLNHPQLEPKNLYAFLSALESAEKNF
jgi:hypothetical protein